MICTPFLVAINSINLRMMREMNDYTVTTYVNIAMTLFYGPAVFILGYNLSVVYNFDSLDWVL